MKKTLPNLIDQCRSLRHEGFSFGEIAQKVGLPKTTVYGHVFDIPLSPEARDRFVQSATKRINAYIKEHRRGKAWPQKAFAQPESWSQELIFTISHFMFDGRIYYGGCQYYNSSDYLIQKMQEKVLGIFGLESKMRTRDDGVKLIGYYNVEFAAYVRQKSLELLQHIRSSQNVEEKRIFLQAFFDDEGNISFDVKRNRRQVRGFQHNIILLQLIQSLLEEFEIQSRIDKKYYEVIISRRENLVKFRSEINFSKGVYLNPKRSNSVWKKKLQKRDLLNLSINSFQK